MDENSEIFIFECNLLLSYCNSNAGDGLCCNEE
jgi:hypothetical protein